MKANFRAFALAVIVVAIFAFGAILFLSMRPQLGDISADPTVVATEDGAEGGVAALLRITALPATATPTRRANDPSDVGAVGTTVALSGTATPLPLATATGSDASPVPLQATDRPQQRVPVTRLAQSATPFPTSSQPASASPTATATRLAVATATARTTSTAPTSTPSVVATATASATASGTRAAATPLPSVTPLPTFAPPGTIRGRLTLNGTAATEGTELMLERDQAFVTTALATVGPDGRYSFEGIPPSDTGYNVVFAQEFNESLYTIDQVVSWSWIGPIDVASGQVVDLPDFEIALNGWQPLEPAPESSFSAAAISAQNPILFRWSPYLSQATYWVDLVAGESQQLVWQSDPEEETSIPFGGLLTSGQRISPGEYWWGVGGYYAKGAFAQTFYGYLSDLTLVP